jgi:hypothetical protein
VCGGSSGLVSDVVDIRITRWLSTPPAAPLDRSSCDLSISRLYILLKQQINYKSYLVFDEIIILLFICI